MDENKDSWVKRVYTYDAKNREAAEYLYERIRYLKSDPAIWWVLLIGSATLHSVLDAKMDLWQGIGAFVIFLWAGLFGFKEGLIASRDVRDIHDDSEQRKKELRP